MKTVGLIGFGLIGKKINQHLKESGYKTVVFDLQEIPGETCFKLDITSEASVSEVISKLNAAGILLEGIVNCSYPRGKNYGRRLENVQLEDFNSSLNLHLGGYFNVMKNFGAYFKDLRRPSSIVSFSSIYGVIPPRFEIYESQSFTMPVEYAAIKSAIIHLNKYMAKYFKGTDVRFNTISPGGVYDSHSESFLKEYGDHALSSRGGMLDPQDLSGAVRFLLSDESRYINGQNLIVDDGWTL